MRRILGEVLLGAKHFLQTSQQPIERLTNGTGLILTTPVNPFTLSPLTHSIQSTSGLDRRYDYIFPNTLLFSNIQSSQVFRTDLLAPPPPNLYTNDDVVAFMEAVTEPEAPDQTLEKLVGVYRVLIPHKIAAYTYHLNGTSRITDAPTIRSLKFVLQDELDDWRDGEMIVQSLIETSDDVERAAAHQARLEALIVRAGGIAGPGSIGTEAPVAEPAPAAGA